MSALHLHTKAIVLVREFGHVHASVGHAARAYTAGLYRLHPIHAASSDILIHSCSGPLLAVSELCCPVERLCLRQVCGLAADLYGIFTNLFIEPWSLVGT